MKFKRLAALLMALAMTLSLGACGDTKGSSSAGGGASSSSTAQSSDDDADDDTSDAADTDGTAADADLADIIPEETTELVVYSQLANYSGEQIGWFAEVLKEKFNVKFTIINEADGTYDTRMASGDLGDIVLFGSNGIQYQNAVKAGMLYSWDDDFLLDDYGPYIKDNMQVALDYNRTLTDGKLYGFGHNVADSPTNHAAFTYRPDIRWDLYEQLGHPEVNTLEDFVDILADMVALEPESDTGNKTYGVSLFPDWDGDMVMYVKSTAALYGYTEFGFGLYDTKTQTYEDCLKDDGIYLRCLKFYNDLYQKGLVNPDSMTQTTDDAREDYLSGGAFFNIFNFLGSQVYNTPEHYAEGKAMLTLAANDQKNLVSGLSIYGSNRMWTIGAKTDYPELCMAIINWLSTPEGVMTRQCGPKGTTWDYDADGNPYLTELGVECKLDSETKITYGDSNGTFNDGNFKPNNETWDIDSVNPETNGETYNWEFWKSTKESMDVQEITQKWRDFTGYDTTDEYLEGNDYMSIELASTFAWETRDPELDTKWNQVATSIRAGSWNAIYAKTDEEFDQIVKNMKEETAKYGYEECIEFVQSQAEIRKEKEDEALRDAQ